MTKTTCENCKHEKNLEICDTCVRYEIDGDKWEAK